MIQFTQETETGTDWLFHTNDFETPETLAACLTTAAPSDEYSIVGNTIFATQSAFELALAELARWQEFAEQLAEVA